MFGAKLAGIKVILPWTGVETLMKNYDDGRPTNELWYPLATMTAALFSSYVMNRYSIKRRQQEVQTWIDDDLPKLFNKHISTLQMLIKKAGTN